MPKKNYEKDYQQILHILEDFPDGAKVDDILSKINLSLSKRVLQRRIANLLSDRRLVAEGRNRARRYKLPCITKKTSLEKQLETSITVLLSSEGKKIEAHVRSPIQKRNYTNYNRKFLDDYIPNKTFYLDELTREELYDLGRSQDGYYPAGTFAREIFEPLLIDLSWNSSRLEGNTYSLLETDRLLKLNEPVKGKDIEDTQMILNHKEAIEFLISLGENITVNRYTVLNLHALLSQNLISNPKACGRVRTIPVGIGKSVYMPLSIPQILEECFDQIIYKADAIKNPFEQAFFLMVHLPYLQPFEDVNKRVSRISANIPFIRENLSPLSFVDVPKDAYISGLLGIYELNRIELMRDVFVWAYTRSCHRYAAISRIAGEPDPNRLKYHKAINRIIFKVVEKKLDKLRAHQYIEKERVKAAPQDQEKFVEMVETELMALHEGNIARYRITPKLFEEWQNTWA
ncbi:MAG: Fic family protein [Candidatus Algichlamydia australiensis]|nr:Fic family protein [Chlamydiales bacterium]